MAFDTAVKNLGRYGELLKAKISPPFRKELYEKAIENVGEKTNEDRLGLWTAFPYLEPHKTAKYFHFKELQWIAPKLEVKPENGANSDDKDDDIVPLDEILRYLVEHAPILEELRIKNPRLHGYQEFVTFRNPQLEPCSIDLIIQMKNLTRISINEVNIEFSGFVRLCREFKNLQKIEAYRILVDVSISDMTTILETFNNTFDHQEYVEWSFPRKYGIEFRKTDSAEIYREARVELANSTFVVSFPKITHLQVHCGFESDDDQCRVMNFHHILSKVGGNLKKLILSNFDQKMNITFKQIFEHCKILETLDLFGSYISDENEPIIFFGKLKEFRWHHAAVEHTISINSILSAPLLEKIYVESYKFDLGDKEALFNRIRSGKICKNVREFRLSWYNAKTEKKLFSLKEMAFNTIVKNLGCYKELIKLKISPPLRKELYKEAMKSVWEKTYEERFGFWTALPYLEPHKTAESIDLREFEWAMPKLKVNPQYWDGCDFDDDDNFDAPLDEILSYLGQLAPNLKEIRIDDPRPHDFQKLSKKTLLDSSSIDLIVKMKNLTRISIRSVQINFTGFVRICRESQNVQEIEGEEILVDIPKSEMKTILETFNTAFDHQEYTECTLPTMFSIYFKKTDSVEHYRIARVNLDYSICVDSISEITHLETSCGYDCTEYQSHMKNLLHILSKYGGNLKKLTLSRFAQNSELTFKNIFEHCKSLESLDLRSSYIADGNEPINVFGKLKEFRWCYADRDHALTLKKILCAPLLKKIHLISYKFDLGDKEALFNQIRRGEICTNVKYFKVDDLEFDDIPVWNDFYALFDAIRMNSPEPISTSLETHLFHPHLFSSW
ncbi:Hypothetical predicted protein [Cloeon dipterum]|uniref:Uncharacterized protein n=1 Tax=Cloeon dipterum TaxID=197152 RepID=A0A8S1DQ48_9INSE|nr:Hypothetical predicted protein [Cloeon dipterum]